MPKPVIRKPVPTGRAAAVPAPTPAPARTRTRAAAAPAPAPDLEPENDIAIEDGVPEQAQVASAPEDDLIPTPTVDLPPATPDIHDATIEGVERQDFDNGGTGIQFLLLSEYDGETYKHTVFMPQLFVKDYAAVIADPENTLPEVEGEWDDENKRYRLPPDKQLTRYLYNVANSSKTAELQMIQAIARKQGRTLGELGIGAPQNFDEFVEALSSICQSLPVSFTRRPQGGDDPRFARMLRVAAIIDRDEARDPKRYKKYVKTFAL